MTYIYAWSTRDKCYLDSTVANSTFAAKQNIISYFRDEYDDLLEDVDDYEEFKEIMEIEGVYISSVENIIDFN